ncbi:MAG: hypothetical protein ACI3XA_05600 [Clostridia bacterium]
MNSKVIEQTLSELLASIIVKDTIDAKIKDAVRIVTYKNGEIYIMTQENAIKYKECMTKLYDHIIVSEKEISYKFFEKKLHQLLIKKENNIIEKILEEFSNIELQKFFYIRPLYGGYLKNNKIIDFYGYKFISSYYVKEYLKKYTDEQHVKFFLDHQSKTHFICYVEIAVVAKDVDFAKETADEKLHQLDNVLRFMSGNMDKNCGLGMFDFNTNLLGGYMCIKPNEGVKFSYANVQNPPRGIQLDDTWFFPGESGNDKLWQIVQLESKNEIQKRILKSVEWIGRSINEIDFCLSFLQSIFAIECLLQDQSDFITKSITAQIAEYAAFIVGSDLKTRKEIETLFRKLYSIRSKVAHGVFSKDIETERCEAIWLAKQIVINLLIKPEFSDIKNNNDLRDKITELRYGN